MALLRLHMALLRRYQGAFQAPSRRNRFSIMTRIRRYQGSIQASLRRYSGAIHFLRWRCEGAILFIYAIIYIYILRRYYKFALLYRYIRYFIYRASIYMCYYIHAVAIMYICTAKKATCFWPRYYPKPTGYVHVAVCCIGRC